MVWRLLWFAGLIFATFAAAAVGRTLPGMIAIYCIGVISIFMAGQKRFDLAGGAVAAGVFWAAIALGAVVPLLRLVVCCNNARRESNSHRGGIRGNILSNIRFPWRWVA